MRGLRPHILLFLLFFEKLIKFFNKNLELESPQTIYKSFGEDPVLKTAVGFSVRVSMSTDRQTNKVHYSNYSMIKAEWDTSQGDTLTNKEWTVHGIITERFLLKWVLHYVPFENRPSAALEKLGNFLYSGCQIIKLF